MLISGKESNVNNKNDLWVTTLTCSRLAVNKNSNLRSMDTKIKHFFPLLSENLTNLG